MSDVNISMRYVLSNYLNIRNRIRMKTIVPIPIYIFSSRDVL